MSFQCLSLSGHGSANQIDQPEEEGERQAEQLMQHFCEENPGAEQ